MNLLTEVKRKRWGNLLTEVDMTRSSKEESNFIKRLDGNPEKNQRYN